MAEKIELRIYRFNGGNILGTDDDNWDKTLLATATVDTGSYLVVTKDGLSIVDIDTGEFENIYTYDDRYVYMGASFGYPYSNHSNGPWLTVGSIKQVETSNVGYRSIYVVDGVRVNGTWRFNKEATQIDYTAWWGLPDHRETANVPLIKTNIEEVNFTSLDVISGGTMTAYRNIAITRAQSADFWIDKLHYGYDPDSDSDSSVCYRQSSDQGKNYAGYWAPEECKTIDFGTEKQLVTRAFYNFLTTNATDITERVYIDIMPEGCSIEVFSPAKIQITETGVISTLGDVLYEHGDTPYEFLGARFEGVAYNVGDSFVVTSESDVNGNDRLELEILIGDRYSHYMVKASTLEAIANAIRSKTEKTDPIKVEDFAREISSLLTLDADSVATEDDIDDLIESLE